MSDPFPEKRAGCHPRSIKDELHQHVHTLLNAPDPKAARLLVSQTLEYFEEKAPKAMRILETGFDDVTAVFSLPEKYRKRLQTTNNVERLIEEIRRRERVIRTFPNRQSVIRLLGTLLMEQDEKWASGRKYLDMEEYLSWRKNNKVSDNTKVTRIM